MKKFFFLFCSALLCLFPFAFSSFADSRVAFIAYNTGNNANDGLTAATAKKSLGSTEGTGAIGVIPKGGTLVVCEKLYFGDITPEQFLEYNLRRHYPDGDYHRMYIGEIKAVYTR